MEDVIDGFAKMPFTSCIAWHVNLTLFYIFSAQPMILLRHAMVIISTLATYLKILDGGERDGIRASPVHPSWSGL